MDEIYENQITKPVFRMSSWLGNFFDKKIVDQAVNSTADAMGTGGRSIRTLQSGNTRAYIIARVIGMVILIIIRLLI